MLRERIGTGEMLCSAWLSYNIAGRRFIQFLHKYQIDSSTKLDNLRNKKIEIDQFSWCKTLKWPIFRCPSPSPSPLQWFSNTAMADHHEILVGYSTIQGLLPSIQLVINRWSNGFLLEEKWHTSSLSKYIQSYMEKMMLLVMEHHSFQQLDRFEICSS